MRLKSKDTLIKSALQVVCLTLISCVMCYGCVTALDRQAEVDYQECLSWQADGYDVRCQRPQK